MNPPLDWIQVADDVVKIGLGAVIAGGSSLLVARQNAKSTLDKMVFERRTAFLSEAAQSYETYFQAFVKFSLALSAIGDLTRTRVDSPMEQDALQSFIKRSVAEAVGLNLELSKHLQESLGAQCKLMLAGESRCREKSEILHAAITEAHASFRFDGSKFDLSRFDEVTKRVRDARASFYAELSSALKK